jgi:hypothetical protein
MLAAFSFVLFFLSTGQLGMKASAETMSNDLYKIHGGNFNSISGNAKNNAGKKVSFTSGETAPGQDLGTNFKVNAGFQYIKGKNSFGFSISSSVINFGDLKPGEPITRTNRLTVSTGSSPGYQVIASEDHEPRVSASGPSIPDTTCDNGSCSETTPALWSSLLTYGFGYRCENLTGKDCNSDFLSQDMFKQFANTSKNEQPQQVMSGSSTNNRTESEITYKVNVSQSQPSGLYQNNILYIAIPKL